MTTQLAEKFPVRGFVRWLMRFPIWLYRAHVGGLLGNRFLMLTHVGRKSGLLRQVVIEVVSHDARADTYVVASAWGEKSDWFLNIQKTPEVNVHVQIRQFEARAIGCRKMKQHRRYAIMLNIIHLHFASWAS